MPKVLLSQATRTILLREDVSYQSNALKVDREAGVIREAKLLGKSSSNGNDYTDQALEEFAQLYRGKVSYVDHRAEGEKRRSVRDAWAWITENVVVRPGDGVYGDVRVNPKHELTEQILYFAEHKPDALGFSHDAKGRGRAQPNGRYLVEGAVDVESVDLVWKGATTKGLFEAAEATSVKKPKTLREALLADRLAKGKLSAVVATAMELIQAHLDDAGIDDAERTKRVAAVVSELNDEIKAMAGEKSDEESDEGDAPADGEGTEETMAESHLQKELKKVQEELKALREERAKEAAERRRETRRAMLREAGLPAEGELLEQLVVLPDDKARALVEQLKPAAGAGKPKSAAQGEVGLREGAGTFQGVPCDEKSLAEAAARLGFKGKAK